MYASRRCHQTETAGEHHIAVGRGVVIAQLLGQVALWAGHSNEVEAAARRVVGVDVGPVAVVGVDLLVGQSSGPQPIDQAP